MDSIVLWRRLCYLLIGLVFLQTAFLYYRPRVTLRSTFEGFGSNTLSENSKQTPESDSSHTTGVLSVSQCEEAYPRLYKDIDRAVGYWRQREHIISANDVDVSWRGGDHSGGMVRILIADNQLRVLDVNGTFSHAGYVERALGMLGLLHRTVESASAAGETLPTIEASIILEDIADPPTLDGTHSFWAFTSRIGNKTADRIWLLPSFDLWSIGSMGEFEDVRFRMAQYDKPFSEKIPKVVWRGTGWVNWDLRGPLLDITKGQDWADVANVDWEDRSAEIPIEDMCKYAMTVHTEGASYSARLKYLQNCNSLIFIHDRLEWSSYFYHLLQKDGPSQNYVSVQRDWADLEEKVKYYLERPDEAEKIIRNHIALFREQYVTRKATECYLRKLIQGYASVSFTPEVYRRSESEIIKRRRGLSYEEFMNHPHDFDEET